VHGFPAELFHPGFGNQVVFGRIFLEARVLAFRTDTISVEIPARRLLVELDEDEGRIYFCDRNVPGQRIFTSDQSILNARGFGPSGTIRNQLERAATRREVAHRLRILAYVMMACIIFGWLGVCATHLMVLSLVAKVPPDWEQQFGDERIAELKSEGVLLDDTNRIAKLTALVAPLMRVVPGGAEFKFHIEESEIPNAFALPGGHIVVNSGLLKIANNDELVGVIAHESAHITQKHFARKIISSAGPVIIFGAFLNSRNGPMGLVGRGAELILTRGFSQEYETEADEVGWNYLVKANIDPSGMIGVFRKFKAEEARENQTEQMPQAFQSHPALAKRIARLEAKWKKLSRQNDFLKLPSVDLRQ
jgi:predicted Zn-dependent protease